MFVNEILLWAMAAGAIPIIIHFSLKQKPKRIVFPPMQLIKEAFKRSTSSFKLRHILLMMLRIFAILLFALIVARPRVESTISFGERENVCAVIIIDDSPGMGAGPRGDTSFDKAKRRAIEVYEEFRSGDLVALIFTSSPSGRFMINLGDLKRSSLGDVKRRIDSAQVSSISNPSAMAVRAAYDLVAEQKKKEPGIKSEIFVFSDFRKADWTAAKAMNADPTVPVYAINLAQDSLVNYSVKSVLANNIARKGIKTTINSVISSTDPKPASLEAVLWVEGEACGRTKLENVSSEFDPVCSFQHSFVKPGLNRCAVSIDTKDDLDADNVYYFSVNVSAPPNALCISDDQRDGRENDTFYLQKLFSYSGLMEKRVEMQFATSGQADNLELEKYNPIIIVNPGAGIAESLWTKITRFVTDGGGLIIFSGDNTGLGSFNFAQELLPGRIGDRMRSEPTRDGYKFRLEDKTHPFIESLFVKGGLSEPLGEDRASEFLTLNLDKQDTKNRILLRFNVSGDYPALVERVCGRGRVFFFTITANSKWSDICEDFAVFPSMMFRAVEFLTGMESNRLQDVPGKDIFLPLAPKMKSASILLESPDGDTVQAEISKGRIHIPPLQETGNYVVRAKEEALGLSVNLAEKELDFSPLAESNAELNDKFTESVPNANVMAMGNDEMISALKPLELYPFIMMLLVLVLLLESYLSNRIYSE